MKNKKIYFLFGILFIIAFIVNTPSTRAIIKDQTISTIAEKDTYVRAYSPTSNYGGKDWLKLGADYFLGWNEVYLYFNFTNKPDIWTKAEISIDMYSISKTFNVTVSLINDSWNEYIINWINKPEHREIITTFTVAEEKIYKIDITNYIEGDGISICINASDYLQRSNAQATSKEGTYSWSPEDAPQLIWTLS